VNLRALLIAIASMPAIASADATFRLRGDGGWHDMGWPRGTPILVVGQARTTATVTVPASKELVRAQVSVDGKSALGFLIDARDGHHYTVEPDPCCFLTVSDADDGLAKKARCGGRDSCPAGTVAVDKFVFRKDACGERLTCAAPAMVRVRVAGGPVTLEWDGSDAAEWTAAYRVAPVGREHPQHVVARRAGAVVWQDSVVLHHGARYTIVLDGARPHVTID
jgi:hypothetical protein